MNSKTDPMGRAILDYYKKGKTDRLRVFSPMFEEDEIPLTTLFRSYMSMPSIEQKAIELAKGKTLDVGAAPGYSYHCFPDGDAMVYHADKLAGGCFLVAISQGVYAAFHTAAIGNDGDGGKPLLIDNGRLGEHSDILRLAYTLEKQVHVVDLVGLHLALGLYAVLA